MFIGRVNVRPEHPPPGIHHHLALQASLRLTRPFTLLAPSSPRGPPFPWSSPIGCPPPGRWERHTAFLFPGPPGPGPELPSPKPLQASLRLTFLPLAEVVVDRGPVGQVMGPSTPLDAVFQNVQDSVAVPLGWGPQRRFLGEAPWRGDPRAWGRGSGAQGWPIPHR